MVSKKYQYFDTLDNPCVICFVALFLLFFYFSGLYRTERDKGTLYELFFAKEDSSSFRHVTLFRPFGPLMKVRSTFVETSGMIINIIVPLAGRVETFSQFLHNFR